MDAATKGNIEKIKSTLKKAQEQNITSSILNAQDDQGYSALHSAIYNNHDAVVDELLKNNCNVNTTLNERSNQEDYEEDGYTYNGLFEGRSPLMDASYGGQLSLVEKLIKHNAQIDAVEKTKCNAVVYAAQRGHVEILNILLKKNQSLSDQGGHQNTTPLGAAAWNGHLNVVKELIQNWRVDINSQNQFGSTPLHVATEYNHTDVIEFLLQSGADPSIKDNDGKVALDYAKDRESQ